MRLFLAHALRENQELFSLLHVFLLSFFSCITLLVCSPLRQSWGRVRSSLVHVPDH